MATRDTERHRWADTWPGLLTGLTATGGMRALSWLCSGPHSRPSTGAAGELPLALGSSLTSPLPWGPSLAPGPGSVCLGSRAALPEAGLAEKDTDSPPSGWRGSGPRLWPQTGMTPALLMAAQASCTVRGPLYMAQVGRGPLPSPSGLPTPRAVGPGTYHCLLPSLTFLICTTELCLETTNVKMLPGHESQDACPFMW